MSGHGGKKKRGDDHGEHVDERWLITYADLMTLLVALFMVLFSISSVNKSKLESLQHSLQDAFSGKVLPGGQSIKESGGVQNIKTPAASPKESSLQPYVGSPKNDDSVSQDKSGAQGNAEEQAFEKLKKQLDKVAAQQGLSGKIKVSVTDDGLLIRLLTDKLLFDSGSAVPRQQALPLLNDVAGLLSTTQKTHQLIISGNTDDQPIHSAQFHDNMELSTERALAIFRTFDGDGISPLRMTAAGRGAYAPIASNKSYAGRSLNRRVEILVPRISKVTAANASTASATEGTGDPSTTAKIPSIKPTFANSK
ncbi:MAG TPA: flagellar motor protein MotB [Baekduia sp.]|uniref:flagellar motor protein MotB n=1 Tax=Baekduia sp. TaxID=2600305 RepID=UPI002D7727B2|nr:flagellar motor protein MotB [Baekduia sp.]HET6508879.1 flagellar motor protein MotB [Baekduia sp.]